MEGLYLADLASAVEIVLPPGRAPAGRARERRIEVGSGPAQTSLDPGRTLQERLERLRYGSRGGGNWGVPALVRAGSSLGDAIAGHRTLGREDRTVLETLAVLILILALIAGFFPWFVGGVVAILAGWIGIVLGVRSFIQARRAWREEEAGQSGRTVEAGRPGRELKPGESGPDGGDDPSGGGPDSPKQGPEGKGEA
jgi:hypothetical protein